jgi:hypothetical protein
MTVRPATYTRPAGSTYLAHAQRSKVIEVVCSLGLDAQPNGSHPGYELTFVATWDTPGTSWLPGGGRVA